MIHFNSTAKYTHIVISMPHIINYQLLKKRKKIRCLCHPHLTYRYANGTRNLSSPAMFTVFGDSSSSTPQYITQSILYKSNVSDPTATCPKFIICLACRQQQPRVVCPQVLITPGTTKTKMLCRCTITCNELTRAFPATYKNERARRQPENCIINKVNHFNCYLIHITYSSSIYFIILYTHKCMYMVLKGYLYFIISPLYVPLRAWRSLSLFAHLLKLLMAVRCGGGGGNIAYIMLAAPRARPTFIFMKLIILP